MKGKLRKIICVVFIIGLLGGSVGGRAQAKAQVTESTYMALNAVAKSMTEIQLSWRTKKVTKYKIYRAIEKADGNIGTYHLVATLDGKTTKFLDRGLKKKQLYWYQIKGYKKSQLKYYGDATKYTGLWCQFDEYQVPDMYRSTDKIKLGIYSDYGVCPDGYKIYRREEGTKKFQLIKTLKKKTKGIVYYDKAVTAGKIYYYKVKVYRRFGKKTYYSKCTDVVEMSATNQTGKFKLQFAEGQSGAEDETVIQIISADGNGEIVLSDHAGLALCRKEDAESHDFDHAVQITAYSTDGKNWKACDKEKGDIPVIRENESVWIRIKSTQQEKIDTLENLSVFELEMMVRYNHLTCVLDMDLLDKTASAFVYEEAYH